ncbi:kinesin-like protein KIN-7H isoform X1 [Carica papaya]|uniref:kinesin-like protein KIN-7H isoform X1 n=2 Tax=Carica papaya TaxID=3649 RepID=UPI000B8C9368|nr:kinesin-like protein KIN-7H isoform X1 [Carica papaya]
MGMADEVETPRSSGREEKIFVSVRLRPLNEKEISRTDVSDWECINDNTIISSNSLSISERSMYPTAYTFDRVFSPDSSTRQVYEEGAKEVALSVVKGINASVFAYGQTSSGKTYTMTGITDYTLADIYDYIERHQDRKFILKFSAMEIYNESVRDLLSSDSSQLRLLDDPEKGTVIEKLTEEILSDWKHFKELLSVCEAQRQIGETALNEASSRSHQILRLTIESSPRELGIDKLSTLTATVNFVDLAGSERASQSLSAGTRLKEGCHINRSLLTLGTVIRKLSKGRSGHIPFRDSKLTRILQPSLGGNARTAIICTLSPARIHLEQSRNTLLFATCAKEVITNAQVNIVMSDKVLVKHLRRELARLESELRNSVPISTSDSAALLREKDLEIEKLKNEVRELTMQRDLALSEVESVQRLGGNEESSTEWVGLDNQYPKLRVRNSSQHYSWDSENPAPESPVIADTRSEHVGVRISDISQQSDKHSRTSSDDNLFQLPDLKVNFTLTSPPQQPTIKVPGFVETDLHQEQIEENPEENFEGSCKTCINIGKSSSDRYAESNLSDPTSNRYEDSSMTSSEVNTVNSGLTEVENENGEKQEFETYLPLLNREKDLGITPNDFIIPSPEKSSPGLLEKEICGSRSLKLVRSRSCKASLTTSPFSPWLEKEGNNKTTPSNWLEKDFSGRPVGIPRKFSFLKYDDDRDRSSSNESLTCINNTTSCEPEAQNVTTSEDYETNCLETIIEEVKEMTNDQYGKQPADPTVREAEREQWDL